jgi:hypothetical protein
MYEMNPLSHYYFTSDSVSINVKSVTVAQRKNK